MLESNSHIYFALNPLSKLAKKEKTSLCLHADKRHLKIILPLRQLKEENLCVMYPS